jgi:pyruvate-ferredoxin/flavodoxin oxidoreductase
MDVMATRVTGIALLSSHSPQEAHDMALAAHVAAFKARYPILHFFDGFQVSHQLSNVELIPEDVIKKMAPYDAYVEHQQRAVNPHHPRRYGASVTGDIYMQMMVCIQFNLHK